MQSIEELSSEIFRRCARAAGLIDPHQPIPQALEAFGLMVALECAELADHSANGMPNTGESIRAIFFDRPDRAIPRCFVPAS
ncbi:hypothetical protein [Variovorax sp. PBS-H4]|uniref:hypothetical protein n=1 Tax=Variovorax sp. PBS-H4 TaxID=434008 RepID=UPI0013A55774|nr:hypothetical protein [Variovorax sp. PBS-H4]